MVPLTLEMFPSQNNGQKRIGELVYLMDFFGLKIRCYRFSFLLSKAFLENVLKATGSDKIETATSSDEETATSSNEE